MNRSSFSIILGILLTNLASLLSADGKPSYTYTGEVAGLYCSACSGIVKECIGRIEGVTRVKITRGNKEGTPAKLEIISSSPDLTREAAVKALGDHAKSYDIRSLKRSGG